MSSSTNSFSGDFLLLAIASPKLRSMCTLESVTSAKHFSRCGSRWYHIWSQSFLSAANKSFTCRYSKPAKMMGHLWGNLLLHFQFGIKHTMPGIQIPWRISLNLQESIKQPSEMKLTEIRMYWIQLPIFPSSVSHCIFWTSSLLNFSTPSFRRLCSNVEARTSLHPRVPNEEGKPARTFITISSVKLYQIQASFSTRGSWVDLVSLYWSINPTNDEVIS